MCAKSSDNGRTVVPDSTVEPCRMTAERMEDPVHFKSSKNILYEDAGFDAAWNTSLVN